MVSQRMSWLEFIAAGMGDAYMIPGLVAESSRMSVISMTWALHLLLEPSTQDRGQVA